MQNQPLLKAIISQETSDNIIQKRKIPQRHARASKTLKAPMRRKRNPTRGVNKSLKDTLVRAKI